MCKNGNVCWVQSINVNTWEIEVWSVLHTSFCFTYIHTWNAQWAFHKSEFVISSWTQPWYYRFCFVSAGRPLKVFRTYSVYVLGHRSCAALWETVDCSPPGSSVHGILQARVLEWVASSSSRGSSRCGDWTLHLLHWWMDALPLSHQGSWGHTL